MPEFIALILSYLLPILASILASLAGWGLLLLARKIGLDVSFKQDNAIRTAIRQVVFGVEELAAHKLKIENKPTDKAQLALDMLTTQFPKMLPDDLKRMMHEELGMLPGMGASGFVGTSSLNAIMVGNGESKDDDD